MAKSNKKPELIKLEKDFDFEELLEKAGETIDMGAPGVILDFSEVDYIRSSVAAVLVGLAGLALDKGAFVAVAAPRKEVLEIFEALGVDRVMTIYDTVEEAVNKYQKGDEK